MTKNDFILQAMLQMAANEKYVEFPKGDDGTEFPSLCIECIYIDAEALANEAEKRMDEPFDEPQTPPTFGNNELLRNISEHIEEMKDSMSNIADTLEKTHNNEEV